MEFPGDAAALFFLGQDDMAKKIFPQFRGSRSWERP